MNWSGCGEVEQIPGKLDGMTLLKGTSVPAVAISEDVEYWGVEELAQAYGVDLRQVQAVLDYVGTRR